MKKILGAGIFLIACLFELSAQDLPAIDASSIFSGDVIIELSKDSLIFVNFENSDVNIATRSKSGLYTPQDFRIDTTFQNQTYRDIFLFGSAKYSVDKGYDDALDKSPLRDLVGKGTITTGKYNSSPVSGLQVSSKSFIGVVQLAWSSYPDATGYLVFRADKMGNINAPRPVLRPIANIRSGITPSYNDADINFSEISYDYYVLAYNLNNDEDMFVSGATGISGKIDNNIEFTVLGGNEELLSMYWRYDNSLLRGTEYEAINETVTNGTNGEEIYNLETNISEFNIGNSRLQFDALEVVNETLTRGINLSFPQESITSPSTFEFWVNPGVLTAIPQLLVYDRGGFYVALSTNGLHIWEENGGTITTIPHLFKSNVWTHIALSSNGNKLNLIIDGELSEQSLDYASLDLSGVHLPNMFGPDIGLSGPGWNLLSSRVGLFRLWNTDRNEGQIREDLYDIYEYEDINGQSPDDIGIQNLINQWSINSGITANLSGVNVITGVKPGSDLTISDIDGNSFITNSTVDKAYIFDRKEIAKIVQVKTSTRNNRFDYRNYEVGSGKQLLTDTDEEAFDYPYGEGKSFYNELSVSYDEAKHLGEVNLSYLPGSSMPLQYHFLKKRINVPTETYDTLATLANRRVEEVFVLDMNADISLDVKTIADQSGRSYSMMLRIPYEQTDEDNELIALSDELKLVANRQSELELVYANNTERKTQFITSLRKNTWNQIDIVVAPSDDNTKWLTIPYLNGLGLDTIDVDLSSITFTNNVSLLSNDREKKAQVAYIATINEAQDWKAIARNYSMVPNLHDDWTLVFSEEEGLFRTYLQGKDVVTESILDANISFLDVNTSDLENRFVNYGNVITQLDFLDLFSSSNLIEANEEVEYSVLPFYPESFHKEDATLEVFEEASIVAFPDLEFSLDLIEEKRALELSWNQTKLSDSGYDSVAIYKEGNFLDYAYQLSEYTDNEVAMGETYTYFIRPVKNGKEVFQQSSDETLPTDGRIEGFIISVVEDIIVSNTSVTLLGSNEDLTISSNDIGRYDSIGIDYGFKSEFRLANNLGSVTLSKESPQLMNYFIPTAKNYGVERVTTLLDPRNIEVKQDGEVINFKLPKLEAGIEELRGKKHFVNIYLNDSLVRIIPMLASQAEDPITYTDSLARDKRNDFTFKLYYFQTENKVILDTYTEREVSNPSYADVESVSLSFLDRGTISVDWVYPKTSKIDGFKLYRYNEQNDTTVLAYINQEEHTIDGDKLNFSYEDRLGIPGLGYTYDVVPAFISENGEWVNLLDHKGTASDTYPEWASNFVNASFDRDNNKVLVDFEGWMDFAVDGLIVLEDEKLAAWMPKKDLKSQVSSITEYDWLRHTRKTGETIYSLHTYKYVKEKGVYSVFVFDIGVSTSFEDALPSSNFSNINTSKDDPKGEAYYFFKASWSSNILPDRYSVRASDNGSVDFEDVIPGTWNSYTFSDEFFADKSIDFTITALDSKGEEIEEFVSEKVRFDANINTDNIASASNFIASKEGRNKLKLVWDYPAYAYGQFVIFRDGEPLDTLDSDVKYYVDRDLITYDKLYSYQIKVIYDDTESNILSTTGKKVARNSVFVNLADINLKPVPFAKIDLWNSTAPSTKYTYYTDSLGTLLIEDLYPQPGDKFNYEVNTPNLKVASESTIGSIVFNTEKQHYELSIIVDHAYNFYPDYLPKPAIPSLKAYPNLSNNTIKIKWVSASNEIDHYDIYHNNAFQGAVGKVAANQLLEFTHQSPYIGSVNNYSVVPIRKDLNGEEITDNYSQQVTVQMPDIPSVEFLTSKVSIEDGEVELDWIHKYLNADEFLIERSISELARIDKNITSYVDDTGLPESDYIYKVYPVFNDKAFNVASTSELTFPSIATIQNFDAQENETTFTVDLSWQYPTTSKELSGVRIFREEDLIAELDKDQIAYNDSEGFPNTKTRYEIATIFEVTDDNDITKVYESERVMDTVIYPTLAPIDPSDVIVSATIDTITVTWSYDNESFDYYLFNYKESGEDWSKAKKLPKEEVERLDDGKYEQYITGFAPGRKIDVALRAVKSIEGYTYQTDEVLTSGTFSDLPQTASNFQINQFSNSYYVVTWDYPTFEYLDELYIEVGNDRYYLDLGAQSFYYPVPNSRISQTNYQPLFELSAMLNGEKLNLGSGSGAAYNAPGFISKLSGTPSEYGVDISWSDTFNGSNHLDRSFAYKDNSGSVLIQTQTVNNDIPGYKTEFTDTDVLPGLTYVYNLEHGPRSGSNYDYLPTTGITPGKASVTIYATVETGSTPVSDIEFVAKGKNTLDYIFKKGVTGEDGTLRFNELPQKNYFGNNIVYEVHPVLDKDDYDWSVSSFSFSTEDEVKVLPPLKYKKMYTVEGAVVHNICGNCGVDTLSISITTFDDENYLNQSSGAEVATTTTDKFGRYTLSVPRVNDKYYELVVKRNIPDASTDPLLTGTEYQFIEDITNDTVRFNSSDFATDGSLINIFEEHTKYPLKLQVVDPCLDPLGDYRFKVRIKDERLRYDTTVVTNDQGELDILVPPYDLVAQIESVENPDAFSIAVTDFFRPRRFDFSYQSLYFQEIEDLVKQDDANGIIPDSLAIKARTSITDLFDIYTPLIYQRTPNIAITNVNSGNAGKKAIVDGNEFDVFYGEGIDGINNEAVEITFKVEDNGCPVSDKVLLIKNPGALQMVDFAFPFVEDNGQIIEFYPSGEYKYSFIASSPNMSLPYTHLMEVYLIDLDPSLYRVKPQDIGKAIASLEYEYVITGAKALEGKDVFVEPSKDLAGEINVPLMVLRDPPGDNSYSFIEKGTEISFDFKSSLSNANRQTWSYGDQFELFLYSNSNVAWSNQVENEASKSSKLSFKFNEKITTAKQSKLSTNLRGYLDGRDADVIIGTGFAYQYGVKDVLEYNTGTQELTKTQEYGVTPTEVSTVWYYNRSTIEQTIKYYKSLGANDEVDINFSSVVSSDVEQYEESFDPLKAAQNWEAVLQNVDFAAHPLCQMLDLSKSIDRVTYKESLNTILTKSFPSGNGPGLVELLESNADHHLQRLSDLENLLDIYQASSVLSTMDRYKNLDWSKNSDDPDAPCFCKNVDPMDYIFSDLLDESEGGEKDIILDAYESARKLNIIDNYVFDQLATVMASSELPLDEFQEMTSIADQEVLDQLSSALGYTPEEIQNMTSDELNEQINENWDQIGAAGIGLQTTVGGLSTLLSGVYIGKGLYSSYKTAKSAYDAARLSQRVFQNGGNVGAAANAGIRVANTAKTLKTAKAALGTVSVLGVVNLATSIAASALMQDAHNRVSSTIYEELRKDFYADLGAMVDASSPDNKLVESYSRRNGIENITFSGGGQEIARSYTDTDQSSFSVEGYESTRFTFDIGAGFALEAKTSLGWIVECADCIKFKNKFGFGVDVNQQLDQKVKNETSTAESTTTGYVLADDDDGDQFNTYILNASLPSATTAITPYFYLVGGRSSSPYEEGTISRDLPTITLEDSTGRKYPSVYYNQDPSGPVKIPLKITSGNRFEEGRSLAVTVTPNSNSYGAEYILNNAEIYVGREVGFFAEPGEAIYTNLFVKQGGDNFNYNDLALTVRPWDVKSEFFSDGQDVFDTVQFDVFFRKPLPNLSLSEHDGKWIIKGNSGGDTKENYIFYLKDYDVDLSESDLSYIEMQYKREGEQFDEWEKMVRVLLDREGNDSIAVEQITIGELKEYYDINSRTYKEPTYLFDWDITDRELVDGNYLVRAVAYDENGQFNFSNIYSGVIDRKGPKIIGAPEPKDQVFSVGDQVLVVFDETIDKEYFTAHGFSRIIAHPLLEDALADTIYADGTSFTYATTATSGDVSLDLKTLPESYDGHNITVELVGIKDGYNNNVEQDTFVYGDTIRWSFKLDNFKKTPSPIELISDNNWTYTLADTSNSTISFIASGYDVFEKTSSITRIELEVSRGGSGEWISVASRGYDSLLSEYIAYGNSNIVPKTTLEWNLNEGFDPYLDGSYDVQIKLYGDDGDFKISNSVTGVIDREKPVLVGSRQPTDKILNRGESVSFTFNESINYQSDSIKIAVIYLAGNGISEDDYSVQLNSSGVSVTFTDEFMTAIPPLDSLVVGLGNVTDAYGNIADSVSYSFIVDYYGVPLSPLSLGDIDNWILTSNNTDRFGSPAPLPIILNDYQLFDANFLLDSIELQYRSVHQTTDGNQREWKKMAINDLSTGTISLKKDVLIDRFLNKYNLEAGNKPVDTVFWETVSIPDGQYEIRAIVYGGDNSNARNGIYKGAIDRTPPAIHGLPEPMDGVLSLSDHATLTFTEPINYSILPPEQLKDSITIYRTLGENVMDTKDYNVSCSGNSIEIYFDQFVMEKYFGEELFIEIDGITDLHGNAYVYLVDWRFKIEDFTKSPSTVNIHSPLNFLINKNFSTNSDSVKVAIVGYDVYKLNSTLDHIALQIKKNDLTDEDNNWVTVDEISQEQLQANYNERLALDANSNPTDTLYIAPDDYARLVEGTYEVRARVKGGNEHSTSNVTTGLIDVRAPAIATTSPSDGILSLGDNLSLTFDQSIDVARALDSLASGSIIEVIHLDAADASEEVVTDFFDTPSITSSKLEFTRLDTVALEAFDGDEYEVRIRDVYDLQDNGSSLLSWKFQLDLKRYGPSPVNIKEPSGPFVVNQSNMSVDVVIDGFDFSNTTYLLDEIWLECRQVTGGEETWFLIETFDLATIESQNQGLTEPELDYVWSIDANGDGLADLPDGDYLLRAVSVAGAQTQFSGTRSGVIDVLKPQIISFSPSDGIYSRGDEISFTFNESLREDVLVSFDVANVEGDFTSFEDDVIFLRTQSANKVVLSVKEGQDLSEYDGDTLWIKLTGVADQVGNSISGGVERFFVVDFFKRPPSPVTLRADNNFIVNSNSSEMLNLLVDGYDLYQLNYSLDRLALELRETSGDNQWRELSSKDRSALEAEQDILPAGIPPETTFDLETDVLGDGTYEVRMMAYGGSQFSFSNSISGVVDKTLPLLTFEPQDGFYSLNDYLGFTSNESININADIDLHVSTLGGEDLTDLFTKIQSSGGVELLIDDYDDLAPYDAQRLTLSLKSEVKDIHGNAYTGATGHSFVVNYEKRGISGYDVVDPVGDVVVNKTSPKTLDFVIQGYDLTGITQLEKVELLVQYPDANAWERVAMKQRAALNPLEDDESLTQDTLTFAIGQSALEGRYLLQFRSYGEGGQYNVVHSETVTVDRISPKMTAFDPQDGILSLGEQIKYSFNESLRTSPLVTFSVGHNGADLTGNFNRIQSSSSVTIQPLIDLQEYHGEELTVSISGINDKANNAFDGDLTRTFTVDYETLPPSPATLKGVDGFVVNVASSNQMELLVDGYDLYNINYELDSLALQVRRTVGLGEWQMVARKSVTTLKAEHTDKIREPETTFTLSTTRLNDGPYDVRAVSYGGGQFDFSNTLSGTIDRLEPVLTFEPVDGFYSLNDFLGITSNEDLDIFNDITLEVTTASGEDLTHLFDAIQSGAGLELLVKVYDSLAQYDTETLTLSLTSEVYDAHGNMYTGATVHDFVIDFERKDISSYDVVDPVGDVIVNNASEKTIDFVIQGYELNELFKLDKVELLVQYPDAPHTWSLVDGKTRSALNTALPADELTQDMLSLTINDTDPEGMYLLQFRSYGGDQYNVVHSQVVDVDRVSPKLQSFSPSDSILSRGGAISFDFNESLIGSQLLQISVLNGGEDVSNLFRKVEGGSTVTIQPQGDLSHLDGATLAITLSEIYDEAGNEMDEKSLTLPIKIDYFNRPASPVAFKDDADFVINQASPTTLMLEVTGYDIFEFDSRLDSLVLEYRFLEGANGWISHEVQNKAYLLSQDVEEPLTAFTFNTEDLPQGKYAVRVVSHGGTRVSYSGQINGVIDLNAPLVLGDPSPVDQILDVDDEIQVTFNEDISMQNVDVTLRNVSKDEPVDFEWLFTTDQINAIIRPEDHFKYLGDSLELMISGVQDLVGNQMSSDVSHTFTVNNDQVELSDLSLSGDGWVVSQHTEDEVPIVYSGFDVITKELDSVVFEYRKTNSGSWEKITMIDREYLLSIHPNKQDTVHWSTIEVADGAYTVRGVVYGFGGESEVKSSITGVIDRTAPQLLSVSPADSSYTFGDRISFAFDEALDCGVGYTYEIVLIENDEVVQYDELFPTCDEGGTILFGPNNEALHDEAGKEVRIKLSNVQDVYGNQVTEPITISFEVEDFFLETSPVSLTAPINNFVINESSEDSLAVVIADYDFTKANYALDSIIVQYSKTFDKDWKTFWSGTVQDLTDHYQETGQTHFDLTWYVPEEVEDDYYSIRATAFGNEGVARSSQIILGELDRLSPEVTGVFDDNDGIISISLSEELSKDLSEANIVIRQMVNGVPSSIAGRVSETQKALSDHSILSSDYYEPEVVGKSLNIHFSEVMMNEFGNQTVEMFVEGLKDHNGNLIKDRIYSEMKVPINFDEQGTNLQGKFNGEGGIDIGWYYSGAIETKGYYLERLYDTEFERIYELEDVEKFKDYWHTDKFNYTNEVYYRIKYKDTEDVYSKIIKVTLADSLSITPIATVYPNPSSDRSKISFRLLSRDFENGFTVKVYSDRGILIKERVYSSEAIKQTYFTLDFNNSLSAGTYYVEIVHGKHTSIQRIILN